MSLIEDSTQKGVKTENKTALIKEC